LLARCSDGDEDGYSLPAFALRVFAKFTADVVDGNEALSNLHLATFERLDRGRGRSRVESTARRTHRTAARRRRTPARVTGPTSRGGRDGEPLDPDSQQNVERPAAEGL
jgi:hypothetical protein